MKDSGARQEFETGAHRDLQEGKGRYDLISTEFNRRLAVVMEKGAVKYGDRNWEKGMPLSRYYSSARRHLDQAFEGRTDEDHITQAAFNVMAFLETLYKIDNGLLPRTLDDRVLHPIDRNFVADKLRAFLYPDEFQEDCVAEKCTEFCDCQHDEPDNAGVVDQAAEAGHGTLYDDNYHVDVPEGMVKGLDGVFRGPSTVDPSVAPGTPPQEPVCGPPVPVSPTMDHIRGHRVDL
jgi:hypothetical protein